MEKELLERLAMELQELNIRTILIVDDGEENLQAARELADLLPSLNFEFCASGSEAIALLSCRCEEIDLILTDLEMESKTAGLDVLQFAWTNLVPAIVVSGGFMHQNRQNVLAFPDLGGFEGEKTNVTVWSEMLLRLVNQDRPTCVIRSFMKARSVIKKDACFGEQIRKVVEGNFRLASTSGH